MHLQHTEYQLPESELWIAKDKSNQSEHHHRRVEWNGVESEGWLPLPDLFSFANRFTHTEFFRYRPAL